MKHIPWCYLELHEKTKVVQLLMHAKLDEICCFDILLPHSFSNIDINPEMVPLFQSPHATYYVGEFLEFAFLIYVGNFYHDFSAFVKLLLQLKLVLLSFRFLLVA